MKYSKYFPFCLLLISLAFFSCSSKKQMIVGSWHVVKWDDPSFDSFFTKTKEYIDTIGKGHDDATNIELYGVANMDSMREVLRMQYDSAKNARDNAVAQTLFTFKSDGSAFVGQNGMVDTGKWVIDNDNALIIEDKDFNNPQGMSKYRIVDITDKQLVLRFYSENDSNTVTFEHERK